MTRTSDRKLTMENPANYLIRIQGHLPEKWHGRLGNMEQRKSPHDNNLQTTLYGKIANQAELSGILNTLYDLHLPVISVECIKKG